MSDPVAFQEVDEAVRQDELRAWWKRYGTLVVAGAVALVVAVAGFVGWRQYDTTQRAAAGATYSAALARIGQDNQAARGELDRLAASAPGPYRSLAALAAAQLFATPAEQVAALQRVASGLPPELSDLALVIAGYRGIDGDKPDELLARLEPLAGLDRPFRVSVRELQGLAAARKGDLKRAREIWEELAKERGAPSGITQRAQALLNLYGAAEAR